MTAMAQKQWNGWRVARWSVASVLLLTPLVAMQFTDQVQWTVGDFTFAGFMIIGTALLFEWAAKLSDSTAYRLGAAAALAACFLLIWINLAVGIVGNEDDPRNALYFGEILLAAACAITARLRPGAMARGMLATGAFQLLVAVVLFADGGGADEPVGTIGILAINLAFAALWLVSAGLFGAAARLGRAPD